MDNLDNQLYVFKNRLKKDVGVEERLLSVICSTIYKELSQLSIEELTMIEVASPVPIVKRVEELQAFNMMMNRVNNQLKKYPEIVRAQIIVQNYICFVYMKETCFEVTKKVMPPGTLSRKICKFLLNNPVRAFRNSIAHGNWEYEIDFSGLKYYAHKGEVNCDEEMSEFNVSNDELNFWQTLARGVAYTIYAFIINKKIELGRFKI